MGNPWEKPNMSVVKFSININSSHAAIVGNPQAEIIRILREMIDAVECGLSEAVLFDSNGKRVGECKLEIEK